MSATLLITSGITGALVLASYAVVLADVTGFFPLPKTFTPTSGYIDSHYWLGMKSDSIIAIIVLQVLAGVGFVVWEIWLATHGDYTFPNSILSTLAFRIILIQVFLWASFAWPFLTYFYMHDQTLSRAILACVPLWIAALATIIMIGGTFEAQAPPHAILSILFFGLVVVLADGVGWAAVCIKTTLN